MGFFEDIAQRYGFSVDASDQAAFDQGRLSEADITARMASRAGPTASAGGSGGDADLDGNAQIDAGWNAFQSDPGENRFSQSSDPTSVGLTANVPSPLAGWTGDRAAYIDQLESQWDTIAGRPDGAMSSPQRRQWIEQQLDRGVARPVTDASGRASSQFYSGPSGSNDTRSYGALAGAGSGSSGSPGTGSGSGETASFGAAPAAYGETYTSMGRPSWLQGEYVPGQWNETFQAPAKSAALQTEYALPTQADLEASPGYLAGQTAMQRGMERSAAAKGSILSGGFVGRTLPRAMGEYAGGAYNNLVGQTLGARQQQYGEYSGDVSNAFAQYQQRYGQFADAEGQKLGARNANEAAFQGDDAANRNQFATRYGQFMDAAGMKRQAENDVWSRTRDVADIGLRSAALARP